MEIINSNMIGAWVKEERKVQGISQADLADMSCLSAQAVCSVEKNRRTPTIDTLLVIAEALGYKLMLIKTENEKGKYKT